MTVTRTLGIDLASRPERTAVCVIVWAGTIGRVEHLPTTRKERRELTDRRLCELICGEVDGLDAMERVAIDAPFGWPETFIDALAESKSGPAWPLGLDEGRARLERRETDRFVTEMLRQPLSAGGEDRRAKQPLSVSADKIASPAMRCAGLLAELARRGLDVARDGSGLVAEVYPDAALRQWDLWRPEWDALNVGYKGSNAGVAGCRADLAHRLRECLAGVVELSDEQEAACARSDDLLDALVCAVLARLVASRLTVPAGHRRASALIEGWIHLPADKSLERLASRKPRP
jgi:predicted nuclease with RNAse H fold